MKYFISAKFMNLTNYKKILTGKYWSDAETPESHLEDFKKLYNKAVSIVGDSNNVEGFYTVNEDLGDNLGNFVFKITYSGRYGGTKYLDEIESRKETFNF